MVAICDAWCWIGFGVNTSGLVLEIVIIILFITGFLKHQRLQQSRDDVNTTPAKLALTAIVCQCIWDVTVSIYFWLYANSENAISQTQLALIEVFFGSSMVLLLESFYIYRLYISFKDSVYEVSNKLLKCLIIITILVTIQFGLADYYVYVSFDYDKSDGSFKISPESAVLFAVGCVIVMAESAAITWLFVRRLFELTLQHCQKSSPGGSRSRPRPRPLPMGSRSPTTACNDGGNAIGSTSVCIDDVDIDVKLHETQLIFLEAITKQSLLIIVVSIGACLFCVSIIFFGFEESYVAASLAFLMAWILTIKVYMALWLSFAFSNKYYQALCKPCHLLLRSICVKMAIRESKHRNESHN